MRFILTILASLMTGALAYAAPPKDGAWSHPEPVTDTAARAFWFHDSILMPVIVVVTVFVMLLQVWLIVRYNRRASPKAASWSHNTPLEIAWTMIPVAILMVLAVFSFPLLYELDREPDLEAIISGEIDGDVDAAQLDWVNVKVMGNQWNWTYTFPDYLDEDGYALEFTSNGLHKGGLSTEIGGGIKNLSVDYPLVLPAGRYIRYYAAASDVIHAFAMPAFAIKTDAVPGHLNQGWFKVNVADVYYGQCSELCGKDHAFMPIEIRIVPQAQFDAWIAMMQTGDFDAANALVAEIQPLPAETRLASAGQ